MSETYKQTTQDRLKYIMQERGIKQSDILKAVKPYCEQYNVRLEKNDMSAYVHGKYFPSQDKLYVLAKALNVSEAWLMGHNVPMERNEDTQPKENKQMSPSVKTLVDYAQSLTDEEAERVYQAIQILLGDK